MTKTELKQNIHTKVDLLEDDTKLENLQEIVDFFISDEEVVLSKEELIAIEEGLKDVEEGRTISYEDLKKKHSEWFGK